MINHNCNSIYHESQTWQGIENKNFLTKTMMCQYKFVKACEILAGLHPAVVIFGTNLIVCFSLGTKFYSS